MASRGGRQLPTREGPLSTGQAFVTDVFANAVSVLDTRRWRVRRVVAAGLAPVDLALDDRANHLVVESIQTPGAVRSDPWVWIPAPLRDRLPFVPQRRSASPASLPLASVTVLDTTR